MRGNWQGEGATAFRLFQALNVACPDIWQSHLGAFS